MHLPKETIAGTKAFAATSDVYLEAAHICIKKDIADKVFGSDRVALSVFYAADNTFLAAPSGEELFRKIHKVSQQMLKMKTANGDKSISIQELLLDNDLDDTDRDLEFTMEEALHILKVKL